MNKIEKQKEHFNNIAQKYFKERQSKTHLLIKKLMWQHFFKDKAYLKIDNQTVLDPMCGYCEGKKIIEDHLGIKIIYEGFDYSDIMVDLAKSNDPCLNVYKMDVTKFQTDKKYDIVIIIGGLHHVFKYSEQVVKMVSNVLKRSGYFICLEPTHNNFLFKKIRGLIYKKNMLFDENTEKAFELKKLNTIFLSNNFEIVDQIYPGLSSYVLFYNPDAFPFLNFGGKSLVRILFDLDKLFFNNFIGKFFSFATLTLLKKR
ncbi:MAG: methyltransferase domain-containing protein [bacterium]